ncbi:MAG: beta-N-acetylglucosaminidase domain-containing protein [Rhodothermaceae bacterium]
MLQPAPKKMKQLKSVTIEKRKLKIVVSNKEERKAANYLNHLLKSDLEIENSENKDFKIVLKIDEFTGYKNKQHYLITSENSSVTVKSPSTLGLLYGVVTLSKLISEEKSNYKIELCNIDDYPSYKRRIFSAVPTVDNIESLLDFTLKNKFETLAIASRIFPWNEVTEEYLTILKKIKSWKKQFGGPDIMQMHNIYDRTAIVISDENHLINLKSVIKTSYEYGVTKTMICADDTPSFKFGEGYVLTDKNDKQKFKHIAEAQTWLMNELNSWSKQNNFENEFYFVPPFYTYEDMYLGEMELYKDTPWEENAYKTFKRDLNYLGNNLAKDIFIVWTGPFVRSRKITKSDLADWTKNLNGRTPFLWDNTMYSHHPFSSSEMFTAWNNDFPSDFHKLTAGKGIFVNGDLSKEDAKSSAITMNDYLWNPDKYNSKKSIKKALLNLYGEKLSEYVIEFKKSELELRRVFVQRKLWFDADKLWKAIRKAKKITTKNPFYYHYNYNRMKALRLQLKYSVSEPESKSMFKDKSLKLFETRKNIIEKITKLNSELGNKLNNIKMPVPDFESIK